MAIINCPDCGNKVSTRAEACPHCGRPVSVPTIIERPAPEAPAPRQFPHRRTSSTTVMIYVGLFLAGIGLGTFVLKHFSGDDKAAMTSAHAETVVEATDARKTAEGPSMNFVTRYVDPHNSVGILVPTYLLAHTSHEGGWTVHDDAYYKSQLRYREISTSASPMTVIDGYLSSAPDSYERIKNNWAVRSYYKQGKGYYARAFTRGDKCYIFLFSFTPDPDDEEYTKTIQDVITKISLNFPVK